MPTAIPFSISTSLSFSPDGVAATCPRSLAASSTFDQKDDDQFELTGAGTVSMTLKAAAKALQISVDASATAAEVNININSGVENIEIAPGGHLQLYNPVPNVGITALDIVYTTSNVVRVVALS